MRLRFIASSIVTVTFMFDPAGLLAQVAQTPLHVEHAIQDKNFYLLSVIENAPKVPAALLTDRELQEIGAERR